MTWFELSYFCLQPFLSALDWTVRRRLSAITRSYPYLPLILDAGGRKSPYTIGLPAFITITDLPRQTQLQERQNLGINEKIIELIRRRRSNVDRILYDDMVRSSLPDESFDCVVAVEVLEHVQEDVLFIQQVQRVLKPNGIFLMTTMNGDFIPLPRVSEPDHKRHYTKEQLTRLLSSRFRDVEVEYAIVGGVFHGFGLKSWSMRRPLQTVLSMIGNVVCWIQSTRDEVKRQAQGTHHLIAVARKSG